MKVKCAIYGLLIGAGVPACCGRATAQTQAACGANGYRVIASKWDGVLMRNWELRQDCVHPAWPVHVVAAVAPGPFLLVVKAQPAGPATAPPARPLLVHAGDPVKLWKQDATVRIEMSGVVEQSARAGERVVVQITRQTDDVGLTVDRIGGIVRGAGDVEMEQ